MNQIDVVRSDLQRVFKSSVRVPGTEKTHSSPSGLFRVQTTQYSVPKELGNWQLTKAEIFRMDSNEVMLSFLVNDGTPFFSWVKVVECEFLIAAEDLYGGQTIIDITHGTMAGYSPGNDGFIWTDHYASPNGKTLAVLGCYFACPTVIKIYDFISPMTLPLLELREIELLDNDEVILGWIDDTSFRTKGVRRKRQCNSTGEGPSIMDEQTLERIMFVDGRIEEYII